MTKPTRMHSVHELRCQQWVELITHYLDDALAPPQRNSFDQHLARCQACTHYLAEMRTTLQVAATLCEQRVDPETKAKLLAAFRDRITQTPSPPDSTP